MLSTEEWLTRVNRLALVARMLAGSVHDVNNVLQVISGNAELLESPKRTDEQIVHRARAIGAKSREASAMLAEVLAFARDSDESVGRVDLRQTATRALALYQHALFRARIDAAVECAAQAQAARANQRAVLQIVMNLVVNAEAVLAGRPGARLRLRVANADGGVNLTVEDNGPGIDPDLLPDLFSPRAADAPRLGIGLVVSRQLAVAQRGSLSHAASPEGGCAMTLSLPAAR